MSRFFVCIALFGCFGILLAVSTDSIQAQNGQLVDVCPDVPVQVRTADFQPGGIILTTFDKSAMWVYNIDNNSRYPLPQTRPCGSNCRMSPDALWITYFNSERYSIDKMHLTGTERTVLVFNATDVQWWSDDTLLVWTPSHNAYLRPESEDIREYLPESGVISLQPGGYWGVVIEQDGDDFRRVLVNLESRNNPDITEQRVILGPDTIYANAASWSQDGRYLAYVSRGAFVPELNVTSSEIYLLRPGDALPGQLTYLTSVYGAVRVNGQTISELNWSPDSRYIAFWVVELTGEDIEANTGSARIHIVDVQTGQIRAYCGFTTTLHTPNPARLIWSPDSTHVAFGGDISGDDKSNLLLALNIETGVFTELSDGVYPALGVPDVIAWGRSPY